MKLVLIDRDGVINEEIPGFVTSPAELRIYGFALEAFALLRKHGFTCVIVTNQSVVGRGIIPSEKLGHIHDYLRDTIRSGGGQVDDIFSCTDHPDQATYRRKPQPGMLIEAMEKYQAAPEATPFIGDAVTDMEAGHRAGCPRYLVMTGKGRKTWATLPDQLRPVTPCADLLDAARRIVEDRP